MNGEKIREILSKQDAILNKGILGRRGLTPTEKAEYDLLESEYVKNSIPSEPAKYCYRESNEYFVSSNSRLANKSMCSMCANSLGIDAPKVRYLALCESSDPDVRFKFNYEINGCYDPNILANCIWVNSENEKEAMIRTVAHEIRHLYQAIKKLPSSENDAEQFSELAINNFKRYP